MVVTYSHTAVPRANRQSKAPNSDDRHLALPVTGNISRAGQINPSIGNLLSMEGNMIDALFNVAVFATLGALSGSVRGRMSELMLTKVARISPCPLVFLEMVTLAGLEPAGFLGGADARSSLRRP
jgi:hypothetical protein